MVGSSWPSPPLHPGPSSWPSPPPRPGPSSPPARPSAVPLCQYLQHLCEDPLCGCSQLLPVSRVLRLFLELVGCHDHTPPCRDLGLGRRTRLLLEHLVTGLLDQPGREAAGLSSLSAWQSCSGTVSPPCLSPPDPSHSHRSSNVRFLSCAFLLAGSQPRARCAADSPPGRRGELSQRCG